MRNSVHMLTARELECVLSWKNNKTMKKVGKVLGISHRTVQAHCYSAMKKLGVTKKKALFTMAGF